MGLGLALMVAGTSALAFQEQGGAPVAPTTPPEARDSAAPAEKNLDFSAPKVDDNAGTEVRIPGLGKLGVLPKMDFGLELLYGASDASKQADPVEPASPSEDLTIRGTVKHNF